VTVACEPTGHRWRVLGQLAAQRSIPFVCVQPMLSAWARPSEDLTFDKTDEKDAVLIGRLTAQLRCYAPSRWMRPGAGLRHLGARREQLLTSIVSEIQQMRALLECVRPAALECAQQPFRSKTWTAAMHIVCDRDGGDLARTRRLVAARFEQAVRREIVKRGAHKPRGRIVRKLFAALADPAGVLAHRRGALERVQLLLADWVEDQRRLANTETRTLAVLDELHLTELVSSIDGVSPIGAAAILAETGDPKRFASARALVKHAGLAPREKLSGTYVGRTKLTGQGRPGLRLAAWRVVWAVMHTNTVDAALYRHLTSREHNKLTPTQAQTVIAAAVLRQLHAVIVTGNAWNPDHRPARHPEEERHRPRRLTIRRGGQADGRGEPTRH
jgi:transposase